jgi:hypothetical protein
MQLKESLTLIQRKSHLVSKYLHAIKVIVDKLVVIDSPILVDDITFYVLSSLGFDFYDVVSLI